jgi:hypothetical protein
MRERDIERQLVKRVKALGGEVRKVQWIGRRGAPDRLVMLPGKPGQPFALIDQGNGISAVQPLRPATPPRTVFVELKAPGIKPEPHQLREHERMREMGQRVEVIDSIEGVERLLA